MKRLPVLSAVAFAILALSLPTSAQAPPGAAELPVSRVVLFSSGVGYFQRDGQVDGNARIDLRFPANDVNDLLKSLVLQDLGGGQVSTVSYDNRNPVEMTLRSFAIDLTANPTLGDLLNQARGERVQLAIGANRPGGQAESTEGVIVGVEMQKQPVGRDQVVEVKQLNLLTAEGLRGVPLREVQRVRFVKPTLDQEFRKALEVLASAHDKQKKSVSLNFAGQGRRPVRVGYVTASPMWKTSYRLALDQGKVFLQGWAVVENTTDEDWNNVRLALVAGRPISFQMDLYDPLFVPRPVVEPELFASLRPPSYAGSLDKDAERQRAAGGEPNEKSADGYFPAPGRRRTARGGGGAPMANEAAAPAPMAGEGRRKVFDQSDTIPLRQGALTSAADAAELGDFFQYALKEPVSIARQKSALLPIINQDVEGARVSIYNEAVQAKFPLLGLRFRNTTALHLAQGPVTVFEGNSYAGDARVGDLQPGETRLLSYAIDLGTEVEPKQTTSDSLMALKVVKGILHATYKMRETKSYVVKNRSDAPRTVMIEHPYRPAYHLVSPTKPAERTRDVYRFELTAEPGKPATQEVVEELPRVEQIVLTNADDQMVAFYLRSSAASPKVKLALEQALALKAKVNTTLQDVQREQQALKVIEENQARMRANLQRLPPTSEAYKRYLRKFDEQEPEIERRQAEVTRLQALAEQQRRAYEDFLANLDVE